MVDHKLVTQILNFYYLMDKMWLIILTMAAVITTAIWYAKDTERKYKLGFLSLVFWGTSIMVFVDHVVGYLMEGAEGEFFETSLDAFLLSIVLVIIALIIWEIVLLYKDPAGRLKKFRG